MQYLRSKAFDILAVVWTVLLSPAVPVLWLTNASSEHIRAVSQWWARGLMFLLSAVVRLDYVERGRENIPAGPCLILCNHQSLWETLALSTIFPDASFVAKVELTRLPVVGWFLKNYPMIMLDRSAGRKAVHQLVEEGKRAIREGRKVLIFPQGTRRSIDEPVKFKRGVTALYSALDVPTLPIAVNSGAFWGPGQLMKHDGTIVVSYLAPIAPGLPPDVFQERAERVISTEVNGLISELGIDTLSEVVS